MIVVKNRQLIIPQAEQSIGTIADNNSEFRLFRIPRIIDNGTDLSALSFRIDLENQNGQVNTSLLVKAVDEEYIILTWNIVSNDISVSGTLFANIRATDYEGTVKWNSFKGAFYIEPVIGTPDRYTGSLSELEQLEHRIDAKSDEINKNELIRQEQEKNRQTNTAKAITDTNAAKDRAIAAAVGVEGAIDRANTAAVGVEDAIVRANTAATRTEKAIDNAEIATTAANKAAASVDTAKNNANTAATAANNAATAANTAKTNADTATKAANDAATNANGKAALANTAATNADSKASLANNAATAANTAKTNTETATRAANTAADNANGKATLASTAATNADSKALLANNAASAATSAATAANTAKTNADTATKAANTAADNANGKATLANNAASAANTAKTNADTATGAANAAATNANGKATLADTAATNANGKATLANTAATNADGKASLANSAASNANTKAALADTNATYAKTQGDYAKTQGEAAKSIVDGTGLVMSAGGDVSNTVAKSFTTSTVSFPTIIPNESIKVIFGRIKKFIDDWNNFKTGILTVGKIINNFSTTAEGTVADGRALKTLYDMIGNTANLPAGVPNLVGAFNQLNSDLESFEKMLKLTNLSNMAFANDSERDRVCLHFNTTTPGTWVQINFYTLKPELELQVFINYAQVTSWSK